MDEQYREEQRRTLLIDQHRLRLFKFVLIDDLKSILTLGLLSKSEVEKLSDLSSRTATRSTDELALRTRVKHPIFGEGSVLGLSGSGSDKNVTVAFDKGHPTHPRYSPLGREKISIRTFLVSSKKIERIDQTEKIVDQAPYYTDISNQEVQDRRSVRGIPLSHGKTVTLHDCVALYLVPKTPTNYRHYTNGIQDRMVFIDIDTKVITEWDREIIFTTGNASSDKAVLHRDLKDLEKLPWNVLNADRWDEFGDGKRLRNSEFLIHPLIHSKFFSRLVVNNTQMQVEVRAILTQFPEISRKLPVDIDQSYFFSPWQ